MEKQSGFMEDFGQKVDLTQRIREVLLNYPEGTTILKELVQNADDAGATKVCFCIDKRRHGVESLVSESLSEWQGPSLIAYNNALFTEEDFESISRIGGSKKQEQSWKTGRFGIGFNSVYHISDLPSFVSGNYVVFFDPQCKFLPAISSANPGKRIDYVSTSALKHYHDQFSPYRVFGCDMVKPFKGTLFRFPLRSQKQADTSKLSKQLYTSEDMFNLLHNLYLESSEMMIFLKNVEVVELYEWNPDANSPTQLYSCYVNEPTSELRVHRRAFLRLAKSFGTEGRSTEEQADVYRLELISKDFRQVKESSTTYLISQVMGASGSRIGGLARNAFTNYGMRLLPWASVAARVSSAPEEVTEGRAFCFLPLPIRTGMSIHINGYFELSANRRDIWYGTDMDRAGKVRSDWNQWLLSDVATSCLYNLLQHARKLYGPGAVYYSMWPTGNHCEPWLGMIRQFYRSVVTTQLLYSNVGNGKWLAAREGIFHDEEYLASDDLAEAFVKNGFPLIRLPKQLRDMLFRYCESELKVLTPQAARVHLQKQQLVQQMHVPTVLDYCLSDLIDEEAINDLRGLQLVPLQDKSLGRFNTRMNEDSYYLCTPVERNLLKSIPGKLVDENIPANLLDRLRNISRNGQSNILMLDDNDNILGVLGYILPPEWKDRDKVEWIPGHNKHPSKEWLVQFWGYLQQRDLLKLSIRWPIIPTTTGALWRPIRTFGLLKGGVINKSLEDILVKVGCSFSDTNITLEHPQLLNYVLDAAKPDVLDALQQVRNFASVSDMERRELRSYLYEVCWRSKNQMNEKRLWVLKTLPVFEAFDGSTFVSLKDGDHFLAPEGVDARLLGRDCIKASGTSEIQVLKELLGVSVLKKSEFYERRLISRLHEVPGHVRDECMLQVIRELPHLGFEDSKFIARLKELRFVPNREDGKLKAPNELYDPDNMELVNLLEDEGFFPSVDFSSPDILAGLRTLGLRTSVVQETIIECARTIETVLSTSVSKAVQRGKVLLSYLDQNSSKFLPSAHETSIAWILSKASNLLQVERDASMNKFWNELTSICWCPVLMEPPHSQMPWPQVSQPLAPPRLIRLPSDAWLASATMRILDGKCDSPGLCQRFGWLSKLSGNILAAQLLELSKKDCSQILKVLATTIPRIYSLLSDMLGSEEMEVVRAILEDCPWIWTGGVFAKPEIVVFDGFSHLAPYLYVVPPDFAAFRELFKALGVRENLEPAGYSRILSVIAQQYAGAPLDSRLLGAVIWIVQHLADVEYRGEDIFVPDTERILVKSSELVYNDAPWLLLAKDGVSNRKLVHPKISNDVAEKLGVSSVRRSLLAESADFMDLGLHSGMEAFGQSESLTNRLKHIVEMYADGPGIFFELLQNADDAGATEVCFLLDKSNFGTSSILSRKMADWQGPALYCYNNSVFTSQDLYAISRIGQNSKLEKPSAVGRFGLGFNSVYHFTDIPSFVSGTNIVLLDPHAANLPGVTPAQPGLKINFVGKSLLKQFPDQFEPFLLFGCDLQKTFPGTLFRFPLRTKTSAARSEIKQEAYGPEDVLTLFSALDKSAGEALLFLRSVKCVKVYIRENLQEEMQEVLKIERHDVDYVETELQEFVRRNKDEFIRRLESTVDKKLPMSCGKVELMLTRAEHTAAESQTWSWLICSALGGGEAKRLALQPSNRTRGFVPWSGVAAKLSEDVKPAKIQDFTLLVEDTPSLVDGQAFCFLPLPVRAGLPVHVNGYFELSANRREIWYGGDMVGGGRIKSEWNTSLLRDGAARAYSQLLLRAAMELGPCQSFYSLWPTRSVGEPWDILIRQVYKTAVESELPVLYTRAHGGRWISAKHAFFPDFSFPDMEDLGGSLIEAGARLVSCTRVMVDKFREVYPSLRFFTPDLLRRMLISSRRTFDKHTTVLALKYCMMDVEGIADELKLHGLSLLPMHDGSYGTFASRASGEKMILANEEELKLLTDVLPHLLVNVEAEDVLSKLKKVAENGVTNVYTMSPRLLRELLPMVLPLDWKNKEYISWTPKENDHPSMEWMELLWRYLAANCEDGDFLGYSDWPLLPTTDGKLLTMVKGGAAILDEGWSENLTSLLCKSGCFLVRLKDIPVTKLREYVHEASGHGVLLAFFAAAGGNLKMVPTLLRDCNTFEIRELRQFLFQTRWFTSGHMDDVQLQVLRMLRLFENNDEGFICIAESKQLIAPEGINKELLNDNFIRAEAGKEEHILETYMGLRKLAKRDYFVDHFVECFTELPLAERMQAFEKVYKDLPSFTENIRDKLSQTPFVPTGSGTIEPPERLYDPRISELPALLDKHAFFPSEEYSRSDLLDILVSLGLRRSLGRQGLLDSATSVAIINGGDNSEAARKGKALLAHIDNLVKTEDKLLLDEQFWSELANTNWCPVLTTSPHVLLPWPSQQTGIAPPKLVRPPSDIWLVSASMRILDGDCSSTLMEKLGWKDMLKPVVVANQLVELSNNYSKFQKHEPETNATISSVVKNIYTMLNGFLGSDGFVVIKTIVEGQAWLWTGEGFIPAKEAACDAPAHFHPYLHAIALELLEFKELFTSLGVRETFAAEDYVQALSRLSSDAQGALSPEQLTFVLRVLDVLSEVVQGADRSVYDKILLPDTASYMFPAKNLVYNDAPWLSGGGGVRMVHPDVDNNIARQLGAKSLRYLSVVDQEMTSNLPCIGANNISDILAKYSISTSGELMLFDILEIADCCQARKVHFIYDNQEHPAQSLLQPNLSEFQGPSLVVAFEDVSLNTEEICALHAYPPVKFHGQACRYGSGLLAAYHVTDLLFVVSNGCLYLFDPSGQVLSPSFLDGKEGSASNPIGKAYSLHGTGLIERFSDQFNPFNINQWLSLGSSNVTFFRLPLRKNNSEEIPGMFTKFKQHASNCLLFLKSVEEVVISERADKESISEVFSVSVGAAFATLRHPFQEKRWRKFQLSNFFGNTNAATRTHTIDVFLKQGGSTTVIKWLVVQSLASGQTRDFALDRRYLHYQLTPVGGVAACIAVDGEATETADNISSILSPLPVLLNFDIPVTIFGNFLPFISQGNPRSIFHESLGEYPVKLGMLNSHSAPNLSDEILRATWNRHLLSCVFDSYIELLQQLQHLHFDKLSTAQTSMDGRLRNSYSLWPRTNSSTDASDAQCLTKWLIKPMYSKLVDMPAWQLHAGNLVKFNEGVFVAASGEGTAPKESVTNFLKAHYRIFSVPWDIGKEAEKDTGISMKELTPKALRSLMKMPSVAAAAQTLETQIDLLEYCCLDAVKGDDGEVDERVIAELKGVACPTAQEFMVKLGIFEVCIATKEQQELLPALKKSFLHPGCLERLLLARIFHNSIFQLQMKLKPFTTQFVAANIYTVLPRRWSSQNARAWEEWNRTPPSPEFIRKLWRLVGEEAFGLLQGCHVIPGIMGSLTVLVRVRQRHILFFPPAEDSTRDDMSRHFTHVEEELPWLMTVLGKLRVPIFNREFLDCTAAVNAYLSVVYYTHSSYYSAGDTGSWLARTARNVVSCLVALEEAGLWDQSSASALTQGERKSLFTLLVNAVHTEEDTYFPARHTAVLHTLPIYETSRGDYVHLDPTVHYTVAPGSFMVPDDEYRLPYSPESAVLYRQLGVPELQNSEVLVRCALPYYTSLPSKEQESVLTYIYQDWNNLREHSSVLNTLRVTKFVKSKNESDSELYSPEELIDPENAILKKIFAEERSRFPGRQFSTVRWLQMLRTVGLRTLKDPGMILESAEKIQELGNRDLSGIYYDSKNISEDVFSMAGELVEEIVNNLASFYSSSFCDTLSKVKFIPAESGIPAAAGGTPYRILTSYGEAVLLKDWPLAWTCCGVITRPSFVPPEFSWSAFHLRSPPLVNVVIRHLQLVGQNGGEDVLSRWPNTNGSRSVEEVFCEILQYLSNSWDGLSETDKRELSRHAFIPVANGTRLVTANSLYTKLSMDLAPYVFEIPRMYLPYVNILSDLGMRYEPTVSTMVSFLHQLQQACGYHHLNPNELQAVLSILRFICDNLNTVSNAVDVVVPDENARLVHASSCVYVDAAGSRLVDKIDPTRVRFIHPSLSEQLYTILRVKKLSETVLEEVENVEDLEYIDTLDKYSLTSLKQQLNNQSFINTVWNILQTSSEYTHLSQQDVIDSLRFASENLHFVKALRTKFVLLPRYVDITRTKHQAFNYVNRSKGLALIAKPPAFIREQDVLAAFISRLLNCSTCLPLGPIFNIWSENISHGQLEQIMGLICAGSRTVGKQESKSIHLGSDILPIDAKALQFCPLRPFYAGEIIAWHRDGEPSQRRYGRVMEDIRAPAGQPLYRIRIETSPGEIQDILSSNILSFKSTGGSLTSEQGDPSSHVELNVSVAESSNPSVSEEERVNDLGAVGYAQAIKDILTSMGLPLSLEKQSLLEHTLSLQEQLSSTHGLLLQEQDRADAATREVETVKSAWTCRICLSSEVDTLLVPCGHVACQRCSSSMPRCPFCRRTVNTLHRMYRP